MFPVCLVNMQTLAAVCHCLRLTIQRWLVERLCTRDPDLIGH